MKKVVGVVAEFNPFHNGHKYQLDKIDKDLRPDVKIACVSEDLVQRGELSILKSEDKVNIALECGYDIIIAIPYHISIQNAEVYCSYSTILLDKMGCNIQAFGAEEQNLDRLKQASMLINSDVLKYLKEEIHTTGPVKWF